MIHIGDTVKMINVDCEEFEPIKNSLKAYIGKIGRVIDKSKDNKSYSVLFNDGIDWCLDISEIEKGHLEWIKDEN